MAHEIENNNAFYVNKPAWHGLGTVLNTAPTIEKAWELAYPHHLIELPLEATIQTDAGKESVSIDNFKAIIRDDGKQIGVVGKDFETVQPIEMLEHFRPLLETGLIELETGMSLRDGKQMVVLGKIKVAETEVVKGDPIKTYYIMYMGFDGSLSIGISRTNTRVVCANTLKASQDEGIEYKFKHTKNVRMRMDQARTIIQRDIEKFHSNVESYKYLASKKTDRKTQEAYIQNVFLTKDEIAGDKEISTKKTNLVNNVIDLLDTQKGLELVPAIRGTAWQAYNAVSDYLTHDYGRNVDTRMQANYFGEAGKMNQKAFDLAISM